MHKILRVSYPFNYDAGHDKKIQKTLNRTVNRETEFVEWEGDWRWVERAGPGRKREVTLKLSEYMFPFPKSDVTIMYWEHIPVKMLGTKTQIRRMKSGSNGTSKQQKM